MTFGDDSLTANLHPDSEVTVGDSSSFPLIPLVRSAFLRGKVIQLNLVRQCDGAHEYIQMREARADGHTAGGWRSVDKDNSQAMSGCLTLAGLLLMVSLSVLCWVAVFSLLHLI